MRAVPDSTLLEAAPGATVPLEVKITNTSDLIDGITARVIGLPAKQVTSLPALLPLFPGDSGRLVLSMTLTRDFPAGRHPLTVELTSSIPGSAPHHVDVTLVVSPVPQFTLELSPPVQRTRRRSRHLVECRNVGNIALTLALTAADPDRLLQVGLSEDTLTVEPGATGSAMLTVRTRRRLIGSDVDRPVGIAVTETRHGLDDEATATLRHRPLVPRGALTVLVLAIIVGLWAGAFLFGLTKAFSGDPITKTASAAFFVNAQDPQLSADGTSLDSLAKTGTLPAGVGGGIAGTVTAASTKAGIGRIVVEALRMGRSDLVLVSSAATQSDGSYVLLGLLPDNYYLRFTAPGFATTWFPAAATQADARPVQAFAQSITRKADLTVVGQPATISGIVDPGESLPRPSTQITARSLTGDPATTPVVTVTSQPDGSYSLPGLAAPGTYELGFVTDHYTPSTVTESVGAGQQRTEPTVRLSAGLGAITGTVVLKDPQTGLLSGLGGVHVSTSQDGQPVSTITPTQGVVGSFTLAGLATPGIYVVTFALPGFGALTQSYSLSGGQSVAAGPVVLTSGSGTITGLVTSASGTNRGTNLGGVSVTLGGAVTSLATTTLTGLGTYSLSGLAAPGDYTLTFALKGYGQQTVAVHLAVGAPQQTISVGLSDALGSLAGRVVDKAGNGVGGATVTLTDGQTLISTTTTSIGSPTEDGDYQFPDLTPGNYMLTVSYSSHRDQTVSVTIALPGPTCQNLRSISADSDPEDPPSCA